MTKRRNAQAVAAFSRHAGAHDPGTHKPDFDDTEEGFADFIEERFWEKVEKQDDGCWEWTGAKSAGGYGYLNVDGVMYRAHRFSYELHYGTPPGPKYVCHTCDNRKCVNPDHLWLGSAKDNVQDMIRKGRGLVGELNHNSKLSDEERNAIAEEYATGKVTQRQLAAKYGVTQRAIWQVIHRGVS